MTGRLSTAVSANARLAMAAAVVVAFTLAALVDRQAAFAAAHEPRRVLAIGAFVSRFGLSGYMLVSAAAVACVALLRMWSADRRSAAARARRLAERAIFVFTAIAGSGIACQALKHLLGRARPRFLETLGPFHFAGPTFRSGFESFPSGHSTSAFAAAVALSLLKPAWAKILLPAAAAICVSRVVAEAHYPSDILAGALLGTLVTAGTARRFAAAGVAFPVSDPPRFPSAGRLFRALTPRPSAGAGSRAAGRGAVSIPEKGNPDAL